MNSLQKSAYSAEHCEESKAPLLRERIRSWIVGRIDTDQPESIVAGAVRTPLGGCSLMVKFQPSKLATWVRFPSPAPTLAVHLQLFDFKRRVVANTNGADLSFWIIRAGRGFCFYG